MASFVSVFSNRHPLQQDIRLLVAGTWPQRLRVLICLAIIVFAVGTFTYNGLIRGLEANEPDPYHFYTAGNMWAQGQDPYYFPMFRLRFIMNAGVDMANLNPSAFYYPPLGSMLLSAVSHGSFQTAHVILTVFYTVMLFVSLELLLHILSWFRPITLTEIALVVSFLATGYARASTRMLNASTLICVILLLSFILSRTRPLLSGVVLSLVSLKPTFLPPQGLYFVQRRQWRLLIVCGVVSILITILPLVLSERPVIETLQNWIDGITRLQASNVNDPSPFVPWSSTLTYLHPLVYRVLNAQTPLTSLIAYGLIGVFGVYLFVFALRSNGDKADWARFSSFAGWSLFSMLCVYHRLYDTFLVFPAILYLYLHARTLKRGAWRWYIFLAAVLFVLALPSDMLIHLTLRNMALNDHYLWRVLMPYPIWSIMAVVAAFLWVHTRMVLAERRLQR